MDLRRPSGQLTSRGPDGESDLPVGQGRRKERRLVFLRGEDVSTGTGEGEGPRRRTVLTGDLTYIGKGRAKEFSGFMFVCLGYTHEPKRQLVKPFSVPSIESGWVTLSHRTKGLRNRSNRVLRLKDDRNGSHKTGSRNDISL